MQIRERVADISEDIFDELEIPKTEETIKLSNYLSAIVDCGVVEETYKGNEKNYEINTERVFGTPDIAFSFITKNDLIKFISRFDQNDIVEVSGNNGITARDIIYIEPTIKAIIKNMKFNFNLRFYIGDLNRNIINSEGMSNDIPRYYPKIYKDANGELYIDDDKMLSSILKSKGIEHSIEPNITKNDSFMYVELREEEIMNSIQGVYEVRESNLENLILSEFKRDPKSIMDLCGKIEHLIDIYRNITYTNELYDYKNYLAEVSKVINSCTKRGDIIDPITGVCVNVDFVNIDIIKNIMKFTKDKMVASGKISDTSINDSFYLVKHIRMDDIKRHKSIFVSNYYTISEDSEEAYLRDNIYIIGGDKNLSIHAYSEKLDYVYIPMGGIIHKVPCIKDHRTEVVITYRDNTNKLKTLRIPELLLNEHNIYTTYNKALEDGGQKESIDERMFILKMREMQHKHEQLMLTEITNERKSKVDLITRILKIIEAEKDQSAVIKMLEIEKQTLANQNATIKNTKDGYEFIKTVVRDAQRFI